MKWPCGFRLIVVCASAKPSFQIRGQPPIGLELQLIVLLGHDRATCGKHRKHFHIPSRSELFRRENSDDGFNDLKRSTIPSPLRPEGVQEETT
jgi:hypothetical protein